MAGRQHDQALPRATTATCAASWASWRCGLKSGRWRAGVARGWSSTTAAASTASAEAAGGSDVEGEAMHSGCGCGGQRGLLPDGLNVDGLGVYGSDWSVAGSAGLDGSGAVDELELERSGGGRLEPVVGEDAGGWG